MYYRVHFKGDTVELLTAEIRKALPKLYANENVADPIVIVKFFNPGGAGTWLATEFDGDDTFFGWVTLGMGPGCDELGYFSLSELESFTGRFGLGIERDLHFGNPTLSEAIARCQS